MDYFELLIDNFKEWQSSNKQCQKMWEKVEQGISDYKDAEEYSKITAKWWSQNLKEIFPEKDYIKYSDEIAKSLQKAYSQSAYYAKNVQGVINKNAQIGMKAIEPRIEEGRISTLLEKLVTDEADWLLDNDVVTNISRSAVTDTIKANANAQSKAGLYAYIERDAGNGCCEWCSSVSGRYIYGEQPDDFFRVHKDCTCSITYKPSKQKWQKITYSYNNGRIRKNTTNL